MRVRVKIAINDAQIVCRFLKSYSDFIKDGAWIVYETVLDDCYRLERRLRRTDTLNGNKKISFTLDGLTVMDLYEGFFMPKDDRIRLCITQSFDEANIYMIMWSVKEMLNNINSRK